MDKDFAFAGRISFLVKHRHEDWASNAETYRFPEVRHEGVAINAAKHGDGALHIRVSGPFGGAFEFTQALPSREREAIRVGVAWAGHEIALYLDGSYCQSQRAALAIH